MPTRRISVLCASAIRSGCSCRQGAHHDAQTLTTLTSPCLRSSRRKPLTGLPSRVRPGTGGKREFRHRLVDEDGGNFGRVARKPDPENRRQAAKGNERQERQPGSPPARAGRFIAHGILPVSSLRQFALEPPVAAQDRQRQQCEGNRRHAVGGDDIVDMGGGEVHQRLPISTSFKARMRRAAISARMAVRCSARNKQRDRQGPSRASGASMAGSMRRAADAEDARRLVQ